MRGRRERNEKGEGKLGRKEEGGRSKTKRKKEIKRRVIDILPSHVAAASVCQYPYSLGLLKGQTGGL